MTNSSRIGFMQGRLSPLIDGKIQAFPWVHWREEFHTAQEHDFSLMEWTLDQDRLQENPLMNASGREEIARMRESCLLEIPSLTGDCFMQSPFWKAAGTIREARLHDFRAVCSASSEVGIGLIVMPLVDNGSLENEAQERDLHAILSESTSFLREKKIRVIFESDFGPSNLARFIEQFDPEYFGINYDIGNSAALGYSPREEISAYGERVYNVHIKDRLAGGTTVPLGKGAADLPAVFEALAAARYSGNYILQTARADDGQHAKALTLFRDMCLNWIPTHAG